MDLCSLLCCTSSCSCSVQAAQGARGRSAYFTDTLQASELRRARELAKVIYSRNTCHTLTQHMLLTQQVSMTFISLGFNTQSSTARTVLDCDRHCVPTARVRRRHGSCRGAGRSSERKWQWAVLPRQRGRGPPSCSSWGVPWCFLGGALP